MGDIMIADNLLDYSSNYCDKAGSLWFYSKDIADNFGNDIANTNALKSFMYILQTLKLLNLLCIRLNY